MSKEKLVEIIDYIVGRSIELKNKYAGQDHLPLYYPTIFSQSEDEFQQLKTAAVKIGRVVKEHNGPVLELTPIIQSYNYKIKTLRIRQPDPRKLKRGHVDFIVQNYEDFKKNILSRYPENCHITQRPEHELLGLEDPAFDVVVYFIA